MRRSTAFAVLCLGVLLQTPAWVASVPMPPSDCYAFDNSSRIVDFSGWIGYLFEYEQKQGSDLSMRFCKDVESRSQTGYVDFGRFDKFNYFVAGSGQSDFVQEFYNGDLTGCEQSYDKMGRTAQVNIICGKCLNGQCKGRPGCICNATYESNCRVLIELAIPCDKPGPQVFQGFTVGFHPRSWELVYNGMTQIGFEKPHHDFSFQTGQTQVTLFMTAVASLSSLVQKPTLKVHPDKGLEVKLSGSAAKRKPPTTLSPSMLIVDWRCEVARKTPYEVNITIPVEGYEHIQFVLTKICDYTQDPGGGRTRGWAIFGVLSCIEEKKSAKGSCKGERKRFCSRMKCKVFRLNTRSDPSRPHTSLLTNHSGSKIPHSDSSEDWYVAGKDESGFFVSSTLFCCGGFIYKTKVERQRGIDALPGMTILSACLETVSGAGQGYSRPEDINSAFGSETSWERPPPPPPSQGAATWRPTERKYGAI